MSKEILPVALCVALLMGAGSAYASQNDNNGHAYAYGHDKGNGNNRHDDNNRRSDQSENGSKVVAQAVPEIDATSGLPAIALVLGVALLGAERLRRRSGRNS